MAWRCRFLTARRSQHGSVIAKNDLVKNYRVHPTHWLISTQATEGTFGMFSSPMTGEEFLKKINA